MPPADASGADANKQLLPEDLRKLAHNFHKNPKSKEDLESLQRTFLRRGFSLDAWMRKTHGVPQDKALIEFYQPKFLRTKDDPPTDDATLKKSLAKLAAGFDPERQGLPPVTSFSVDREQMLQLVQAAARLAAININDIKNASERQGAQALLQDLTRKALLPIKEKGRLDIDRLTINLILRFALPPRSSAE